MPWRQPITLPRKVYIAAVAAEGSTPLNALDACLIKIGLPQVSLIKITSILPPDIEIVENPPALPRGCNVPAVYSYVTSSNKGQQISAAIALAFTDELTLVAEHADVDINNEEARRIVVNIVQEMANMRSLKIKKMIVRSVTHVVKKIGCVIGIVAEVG